MQHPHRYLQESDDEEVGEAARTVGGVGGAAAGAGAKAEGGHTAMVADILKEKERAEVRAKQADAEAKGRGDGQVGAPPVSCVGRFLS